MDRIVMDRNAEIGTDGPCGLGAVVGAVVDVEDLRYAMSPDGIAEGAEIGRDVVGIVDPAGYYHPGGVVDYADDGKLPALSVLAVEPEAERGVGAPDVVDVPGLIPKVCLFGTGVFHPVPQDVGHTVYRGI